MKILKTLIIALILTAFASAGAWAAAVQDPSGSTPQTTCPVLGGKIDKKFYIDYRGKRVYFCCNGCDAEFKKDPEKYMKKLQEQGVKLEPCPAPAK